MGVSLARADRNVRWIEAFCRVPEGKDAGQPVRLRPWQKKILKGIYGSPTRRAIVSVGRKNAKTALSGFLTLLHLCGPEARKNSQLYSAAQSRDQAAILFNLMAKTVRQSPDLMAAVHIRDSTKQLVCEELGTVYKALSAEASTAYGLSPALVVHDELGQVVGPRSELYDALETAAGAQAEPLSIIISTQAPSDGDLLSILIDDAKAQHDPKTKLFMWSAPDTLDPFSLPAIKKANPALGDFLNKDEVLSQAAAAKRMPAREAAYRNLVLNQRVSQSTPFVARTVWEANAGAPDPEAFYRSTVRIGLDLSARNDLTALVMTVRDDDGIVHVRPEFFAPEQGVRDRASRDRAPYDVWADRGDMTLTPGRSVDYEWVAVRLGELSEEYEIECIKFDRWRIDLLKHELGKIGLEHLPLEPHGQGYKDMSPSLDILESDLLNTRIRHGGHPVLTWCAANAIAVADPAGNRKLDKSKSSGRIDGMVALAMALSSSEVEPAQFVSGRLIAL